MGTKRAQEICAESKPAQKEKTPGQEMVSIMSRRRKNGFECCNFSHPGTPYSTYYTTKTL
jgi:hypothetical protein